MIHASIHGRLGGDPVQRETKTGKAMATCPLAVNAARTGGETETAWFSLMAFGKQADALLRHGKGDMVSVSGPMHLSKYTGRDGVDRQGWTITVDAIVSARTVRPGGRRASAPKERADARQLDISERPFNDDVPF